MKRVNKIFYLLNEYSERTVFEKEKKDYSNSAIMNEMRQKGCDAHRFQRGIHGGDSCHLKKEFSVSKGSDYISKILFMKLYVHCKYMINTTLKRMRKENI